MNDSSVRILLVGARDTLDSPIAGGLPSDFKVDFVSAAAVGDADGDEVSSGRDVVLFDAAGLPNEVRQRVAQSTLLRILDRNPRERVLAIVPRGDHATARIAVAAGAWDVLHVDDETEHVAERIRAAAALHRLETNVPDETEDRQPRPRRAETPPPTVNGNPPRILGRSPKIRRVLALLRRVAPTDLPVLISGESGTGKELAAQAIHDCSQRAKGPFVPINCAAIPETLLESELFGYERGAFTGATSSQQGRFETANGGTLFLDEIGELSPSLQVKLLRFLEDHMVEHVGGRKRIPLDVRVVAATNCDLQEAVKRGAFREDLFYRLNVFRLHMPPLRERGSDVRTLADYFLRKFSDEMAVPVEGFTSDALRSLLRTRWSGNIRQLINHVRRAVVVAEGPYVTAADLDLESDLTGEAPARLRDARSSAEACCIRQALERTRGNRSEAARALGISRTQLYELLNRHRIADDPPTD